MAGASAQGVHSGSERFSRLLVVLLATIFSWGVPEVIVRVLNPQLEQFHGVKFGGDENSPLLFQTDPRLHWKLRADARLTFMQEPVRINHEGFRGPESFPSAHTVVCLGDSTTFGWMVSEEDTFAGRLRGLLSSRRPDDRWQVLNAGVPGYSSFQVRLLAERLLPRWRPEVVVICVGNNDGWPALQSDRTLGSAGWLTDAAEALVARSHFLNWARGQYRRRRAAPFVPAALVGAGPRVNKEEFAENLRAVIRLARSHGARVVLLSPPVNLYFPPLMETAVPGSEQRWDWFLDCVARVQSGDPGLLSTEIDQALAANPDDVYALWLKGYLLSQMGLANDGRIFLEKALETHPFPKRSKGSYRQIIASTARDEQVDFLDVNELFLSASETPDEHYLDHCHPTDEGHRLIAERLVTLIVKPDDAPPARGR